jgi:hypothetical protein
MTDDVFNQIVDKLPTLSAKQRSNLLERLKLLQSLSTKETTNANGKRDIESRVLNVLCNVLRELGVEYPSLDVLRKSSSYAAFQRKLPDLMEFLSHVGSERIAQDALLKIALELLYWDMVSWQGSVVSAITLMSHIHRIPATVSRHFPGYASSGLLKMIVREHQ